MLEDTRIKIAIAIFSIATITFIFFQLPEDFREDVYEVVAEEILEEGD